MFNIEEQEELAYRWIGVEDDGWVEISYASAIVGHVEVVFKRHYGLAPEGQGPRVMVNWSSVGGIPVADARMFQALLAEGIRVAEQVIVKYVK